MQITYSKFIIFFICLYFTLDLLCPVLSGKTIVTSIGMVSIITFISSIGFMMEDIITEIYGVKATMLLVIISNINKFLAGLFFYFVNLLPTLTCSDQVAYNFVLNRVVSLTFFTTCAYFFARWLNSCLLVRWKIILRGRYFWIRSIISSGICEILFVILAFLPALYLSKSTFYNHHYMEMTINSCIFRLLMNIIFAFPASVIIMILNAINKRQKSLSKFNSLIRPDIS